MFFLDKSLIKHKGASSLTQGTRPLSKMCSLGMDQKWKYLRVFVLLLAITMNKNPNGAATDIEKLTKLVNEIQENFKMEKSQMESTISSLQAELESNKKAIEEEKDTVTRLDKMSRIGTSCSQIANMGNLESDYYLIDNDGLNGNLPPYTAFCKMPERKTFVGMMN